MYPQLNSVTIYAKDIEAMIAFYGRYFGYEAQREDGDRLIVLVHPQGGAAINLHPAAKPQKMGQVLVKLVFDVEDVAAFSAKSAADGLAFGVIHQADGYVFANAKDPMGNSVAVSSRAFRGR